MTTNYKLLRNLYYFGIIVLVVYALPALPLSTTINKVLETTLAKNFTIINLVAILTAIAAISAWKWRKIG